MSFTSLVGKQPAPYRYLALSAAIGISVYQLIIAMFPSIWTLGPLLLALELAYVTSAFASVLMASKPIEGIADFWMKIKDKYQPFN